MENIRTALLVAISAATSLFVPTTAQAVPVSFFAELRGSFENPPNASPGTGFATVYIDDAAHTLRVVATFLGLTGTTTAAHIHCCVAVPGGNAGVATTTPSFVGFPLGVTTGSMDQTYNTLSASTWNPAFVTANGGTEASAEAVLFAGILAGTAYFNIHTTTFSGGEIRGFLVTPIPAALPLFATGLGALGLLTWRRKRKAVAA